MHFLRKATLPQLSPAITALLCYSVIILFVTIADSLMNYLAPVLINRHVHNQFLMGLVISTSSMFGILCDAFFPHFFRAKHHSFFLWNTVVIALMFPAALLFFPPAIPSFIFAMAVWGIYFEFMVFSNSYFINAFISLKHNGLAWGILNTFRSVGLSLAPLMAPYLLDRGERHALSSVIFFLLIALSGVWIFHKLFPFHKRTVVKAVVKKDYNFRQELTVWRIFLRRLWPIYLFIFTFYLIDATFVTIGVLFTEQLRQQYWWGSLFMAAYILPNLFTGFIVEKAAAHIGKKKLAFLSGICGGILLIVSTFFGSTPALLAIVFLAASCISLTYPTIMAVTQDYMGRLGDSRNEMLGLKNAAGSLGFVVGPIVSGFLSVQLGNLAAIGIVGGIFACVALLNLFIVPRKIQMPQKELSQL
jgi:MFS family permease